MRINKDFAIKHIREALDIPPRVIAKIIGARLRDYLDWEQGWPTMEWTPDMRAAITGLVGHTADAPDAYTSNTWPYECMYVTLATTPDGWRLVWTMDMDPTGEFTVPRGKSTRAFAQDPDGYWRFIDNDSQEWLVRNPDAMRKGQPLAQEYAPDGIPIMRGEVVGNTLHFSCAACGRRHRHPAPAPGTIDFCEAQCEGKSLLRVSGYYIARETDADKPLTISDIHNTR